MIITLLGMSGVGKTYWSKQLGQLGFQRFSVDDYIESRLARILSPLGYEGIGGVAQWMGQPYESEYPRTSQTYLDFERKGMLKALSLLDTRVGTQQDLVIDTTGSVTYMPDNVLQALAARSVMVYLHTPQSAYAEMARQYLLDPKPVIWGSSFNQRDQETPLGAIARCYPQLLKDRTAKYQKLAHVTFGRVHLRDGTVSAQTIIDRAGEFSHA